MRTLTWRLGTVIAVAVVAITVVSYPPLLLVLFVVPLCFVLLRHAEGRLAVFVVGGLVAMGGDVGLGVSKLVYAGLVGFCFLAAWFRVERRRADPEWAASVRLATLATLGFLTVTVLGVTVGIISNRDPALIAQDSFTYLLIAVAPMLGLDAGMGRKRKPILLLVIGSGTLAAVGWSAWWLSRRGSSVAGLDRVALVTSFLGFAVFAIALTMAVNASRKAERVAWSLFMIAIPAVYVVAGSRSMVVFGLGMVGILGLKRYGRLPVPSFLAVGSILLIGTIGAVLVVIPLLPGGSAILERFTRTILLLGDDKLGSDGSFIARQRAYEFAGMSFQQSPLWGQGFGRIYPSVSGESAGDLKIDTPILILSKFGIVGTIVVIAALLLVWRLIREQRGPRELRLGETALRVFFLISVGRTLFVAPTEEKGFAYSIALLIAFSVVMAASRPSLRKSTRLKLTFARTG